VWLMLVLRELPLLLFREDGRLMSETRWINDTNQSKMFALAKRFALELIEQPTDGNCVAHAPERDSSVVFPYGEVPKVGRCRFDLLIRRLIRHSGQRMKWSTSSGFEMSLRDSAILLTSKDRKALNTIA
jgi:hypothetical protein